MHPWQRPVGMLCAVVLFVTGCATTSELEPAPGADGGPASSPPASADTTQTESAAETDNGAVSGLPSPDGLRVGRSLIATAVVPQVEVQDEPGGAGAPEHVLQHPTERGAPRVFLVQDRQGDWLQVLLPVRPNGSTGWIRAKDVELSQTGYQVDVDLGDFRLRVLRDGAEVLATPIAYGTEDTPTPGGRFYLTELLRPPDPDGVYGSFAFGLSGFSNTLYSFAGGEGVIGIHGTNDPDSIGQRVSAGCIRVADEVITDLAGMLPLGTPVTISG